MKPHIFNAGPFGIGPLKPATQRRRLCVPYYHWCPSIRSTVHFRPPGASGKTDKVVELLGSSTDFGEGVSIGFFGGPSRSYQNGLDRREDAESLKGVEEESFRQYEQILNSWELIYPIPAGAFEDDFPFPKVGYVGSLEGSDQEGGGKRSA